MNITQQMKMLTEKAGPHPFKTSEFKSRVLSATRFAIVAVVPQPWILPTGRHAFNRAWLTDAVTCPWWAQLAKRPASIFGLNATPHNWYTFSAQAATPPQGQQEGREYASLPDRKDFLVAVRK